MKWQDKQKLSKLIEPKYKQMMIELYKEFRDYDSINVRLEVVKWIENHNHAKLSEMFGKRKYRRKTEKKLKCELDMLKAKNELQEFEKCL